ncbi:TIGR02530 family flagellar biosynthesis protein [Piscibacillus halophilus]|uniref:Flagellar operon protein n=1 Tax=Piscibacillus halophilus TaxID=571933 RepID=A0A1H8YYD3_9BACI|nr:TIGR02530 family flagellar biosynthesis protein [Piscibacillus halophilus]SEP57210.1 flagellar operon protein [Piscibacillus halophilus]
MSHKINPLHHQTLPLQPSTSTRPNKNIKTSSFKDVLNQVSSIKVSKHAQKRLDERNIQISEQTWNVINEKMNEAKEKGVTDPAVILQDAVLIASAKNNTIITAMDRNEAEIVTNVNGTIVIQD